MSAGAESLLMLSSSSAVCYPSSSKDTRNSLQTTPKLPKRERLASFSRLVASENFTELMPDKLDNRRNSRRVFKKIDWNSEILPRVRISRSSPQEQIRIPSKKFDDFSPFEDIECSELLPLPFSPNLLNQSPKYASPTYQKSTPMRSPLYISDRKSVFLGRGSFGNVTLFTYKGRKFALKVTHDRFSCIGERHFVNIRHPHLVAILHIAPVMDKVFICMEFAGHCNLQQVLDTKSELDFPRRLCFTIQIALGLRHCHRLRIVHGDVKPANVIVSPYGICKLGDFGHSMNLNMTTNNQIPPHEDIVGTAAYAAPEVLRGAQPTLHSDIYSFGILLWQVQTRELPFAGEHPHVIIYKVAHYGFRPVFESFDAFFSEAYENTAECCWQEDPHQRMNISDVLQKLKEIEKDIRKTTTSN